MASEQPLAAGHPMLTWAKMDGPDQVLAAARQRIEEGHDGRARLAVTLTLAQRRNVGRLLGLDWESSTKPILLGTLGAKMREQTGLELTALLVHLGGPLRDRQAEKVAAATASAAQRSQLLTVLTNTGLPPEVAELVVKSRWLGAPIGENTQTRAHALARVLTAAPVTVDTLLATFASELFADPHALDRDTVLGRAAARAFAAAAAHAAGDTDLAAAGRTAATAAGWRAAWDSVGVACDQVSSTVLVLNLALPGTGAVADLLGTAAVAGEPLWLTARTLRGDWMPGRQSMTGVTVRVCENPSVVEATADVLGATAPPLVCTYGRPSGAAWALLRGVHAAGAQLLITGDRDPAGLSITRDLFAGLRGAEPWLPDTPGLYEEDRLPALLADLRT